MVVYVGKSVVEEREGKKESIPRGHQRSFIYSFMSSAISLAYGKQDFYTTILRLAAQVPTGSDICAHSLSAV